MQRMIFNGLRAQILEELRKQIFKFLYKFLVDL